MTNVRPLFPSPDTRSLVERLRAWVWSEPADYTAQLTQDAAAELERLRAMLVTSPERLHSQDGGEDSW